MTDANGQPVGNAWVHAQTPDGTLNANANGTADANGAYTLVGVEAGGYHLSFRAAGSMFIQWAHQKLTFWPSAEITVGAREPR
ncbi:hypothetical protein GCM10010170_079730 [Dactylosporangium salmoneum]|uniref:Carboxypeptidase regulatory-like domain-containing protein n=1 Tax=Dactylosporangium salmoneum TaxID=53361 RepID=A0ABP5UG96_9ACTN